MPKVIHNPICIVCQIILATPSLLKDPEVLRLLSQVPQNGYKRRLQGTDDACACRLFLDRNALENGNPNHERVS